MAKPYSFLVINNTIASDNPPRFRKNLFKICYLFFKRFSLKRGVLTWHGISMSTNDRIKDGKLQYDINIKAAKMSALSPGKIDTYEYFKGKKLLPPNQSRKTEQAHNIIIE